MKKNELKSFSNTLLPSIIFYILLAILLLQYYTYSINPDGISYISIAQKYILHDYSNAINGYWSPLLSWFLIPFLLLGFKPVIASKLLLVIIGLFTLYQSDLLIRIFKISSLLRQVILFIIAFLILDFALYWITSDLLFVCLELGLINTMLKASYKNDRNMGWICGLFGSGLYLTKSYGFPFFIVTFFVVNMIFYFKTNNSDNKKRVNVLFNFLSGIIVFCIISICWILIISNKYGYLTIGTAGIYNHLVFGIHSLGPLAHPMFYLGLLDPPNNTAISTWEDITYTLVKIKSWSIFDSFSTFLFQIKKTIDNILSILNMLNQFSVLSLGLLFASIAFLLQKGKRFASDNIFVLEVILIILFSGYTLLFVEPRYIWLANIVILIIGAKLLDILFENISFKKVSKYFLIFIFSASFLVSPIERLYNYDANTYKKVYDLGNQLYDLGVYGRIASTGHWHFSLYISFYNNWHYYGETSKTNEFDMIKELEDKQIDYYFVWKPLYQEANLSDRFEEITNGKIDELRIYKLK